MILYQVQVHGSLMAMAIACGYDSYEMEEVISDCYKKIATIEKSSIIGVVGNMTLHREMKKDGLSNRRKNRGNCK